MTDSGIADFVDVEQAQQKRNEPCSNDPKSQASPSSCHTTDRTSARTDLEDDDAIDFETFLRTDAARLDDASKA